MFGYSSRNDAPNAALIAKDDQAGQLDNDIIVLFNPVHDTSTNTVTYSILSEHKHLSTYQMGLDRVFL